MLSFNQDIVHYTENALRLTYVLKYCVWYRSAVIQDEVHVDLVW